VTAPGTTSEKVAVVARLRRPAMSREAALPGLRLPPVRHHRARRASQPVPAVVVAAAPVVATPVPTPVATWTPTPAPTPVLTPVPTPRPVAPVHTAPTTPNVGMTFDSSG
jgi:hypothetical protein